MHAYLYIGTDKEKLNNKVSEKVKLLKSSSIYFPVSKISDVRELARMSAIKASSKTVYIVENINHASEEAVNAFLKVLEEPNTNVCYILTAQNGSEVLDTIRSRCEIVYLGGQNIKDRDTFTGFYQKNLAEKIAQIDAFKKREDAINFVEKLITGAHAELLEGNLKKTELSNFLRLAEKTRQALKANGNVNLQLSYFILSYEPALA